MSRVTSITSAVVFIGSLLVAGADRAWSAPPGTTRIEEDWELVVSEPSTLEAGPQVTTIMAPEPNPARTLMIFNVNFREEPYYQGGLQAVCWYDEVLVANRSSDKNDLLSHANETIRWTQKLSVLNNVLTYEIANGTSSTWGAFGEGATLRLSVTTHVNSLESYDSAFSVDNSQVGWQANRVQHLRLLRVRYYAGETLISQEETPRDVDLRWHETITP